MKQNCSWRFMKPVHEPYVAYNDMFEEVIATQSKCFHLVITAKVIQLLYITSVVQFITLCQMAVGHVSVVNILCTFVLLASSAPLYVWKYYIQHFTTSLSLCMHAQKSHMHMHVHTCTRAHACTHTHTTTTTASALQ